MNNQGIGNLSVVKRPSARNKAISDKIHMDPIEFKTMLGECRKWMESLIVGDMQINCWSKYYTFLINIIGRIAGTSFPNLPCRYEKIDKRLGLSVVICYKDNLPIRNIAVEIGHILDRFIHPTIKKGEAKLVRALPEAIEYVISNQQNIPTEYCAENIYYVFGDDPLNAHALLRRMSKIVLDEMVEMSSQ